MEQAIQSFEAFKLKFKEETDEKYLESLGEQDISTIKFLQKYARFSNAWYNQSNQFASLKKYDEAMQAYIIAIQDSPFQILNFLSCND